MRVELQAMEHVCVAVRHSRWLRNAHPLWNQLRGPYTSLLGAIAPNGLKRVINGSDVIRVLPELRAIGETYEPDVWKYVMSEVRRGDTIVDVGAHVGLYSIAFAKRAGKTGRVHAFEPDPANFATLEAQCGINEVRDRVTLYPVAAANKNGRVEFAAGLGSESHIRADGDHTVQCVCLDSIFADHPVDLVKIDVEGFEVEVLRGATKLLSDETRAPRIVWIEVHPYAWPAVGTTIESLLALLAACGYSVHDLPGQTISQVEAYGEIVARKRSPRVR